MEVLQSGRSIELMYRELRTEKRRWYHFLVVRIFWCGDTFFFVVKIPGGVRVRVK
jgi:hypothetical protein